MPLAALAVHFNPCGYLTARDNFARFAAAFGGCPLFTCEVSFDGVYHLDTTWRIAATNAQRLWQKEALLNALVPRLPREFDQVAWVDADLLFLNPDWARETERRLRDWPVCQPYHAIHYLDPRGEVDRTIESLGSHVVNNTPGQRQPGGAWAAQRWLLEKHGLYAHNVVGGNDSNWSDACLGKLDGHITKLSPPALNEHFRWWARAFYRDVRARVTYTPGDIVHLYHGTFTNRQYTARAAMLTDERFDPLADVRLATNGLLEWASPKPRLHQRMLEYFSARQEDDHAT